MIDINNRPQKINQLFDTMLNYSHRTTSMIVKMCNKFPRFKDVLINRIKTILRSDEQSDIDYLFFSILIKLAPQGIRFVVHGNNKHLPYLMSVALQGNIKITIRNLEQHLEDIQNLIIERIKSMSKSNDDKNVATIILDSFTNKQLKFDLYNKLMDIDQIVDDKELTKIYLSNNYNVDSFYDDFNAVLQSGKYNHSDFRSYLMNVELDEKLFKMIRRGIDERKDKFVHWVIFRITNYSHRFG